MIDFDFSKMCTGCGVCSNICPAQAIKMSENDEGFLIPVFDKNKCINCSKCDKVCPHLNRHSEDNDNIAAVWLYSSKDSIAKMNSSSGAAWYELGKSVINESGYVVGCIWSSDLEAKHDIGNDETFLKKTQGSKYVQSDTEDVYMRSVELLKSGRTVLFSGTPCQATAMHNYIKHTCCEYRNNLITIGVICHGVASPKAWKSFKDYSEMKEGSSIVDVNFRDKTQAGYRNPFCCFKHKDGQVIYTPTYLPNSKYIESSLVYNLSIRNSCSNCDCKGINKSIDLIIGDWYFDKDKKDNMGTNCIVAFTDRGKVFAEKNLKELRVFDYLELKRKNPYIEKSITEAKNRAIFFKKVTDIKYWDKVEELYPSKYKYKRFLYKLNLYLLIKRIIG